MPTNFEPGEMAGLQLPTAGSPGTVVLRKEGREVARTAVQTGKAQMKMPDVPSLYSLTFDEGERVEKMLSVNVSAKESELRFAEEPEALKTWRVNQVQPNTASSAPRHPQVRLAGVLQQRWWWWMVMGSLLALFLETVWAGAKRERA